MPEPGATLLLVEDDLPLRTFLADNLDGGASYGVLLAETVRDALRVLEYKRPDLAIVDSELPDGSGLELRQVRAADASGQQRLDPGTPLVVLSGRGTELDRARGFERGADDYVVKPFSYAGSASGRARSLRRLTGPPRRRRAARRGGSRSIRGRREVRLRGRRVELSQKEFALLLALPSEPHASKPQGGVVARRPGVSCALDTNRRMTP